MRNALEKVTENLIGPIREEFSKKFILSLRGPYIEQRLIKFGYLDGYFAPTTETSLKKIDKEHYYNWEYFSASYSWDWILFMVADQKIGVDIERIRRRSLILLDWFDEDYYQMLGLWKTWYAFYTLWTAEEALLKALDLKKMEDIKSFELIDWAEKKTTFRDITFTRKLFFRWPDETEYTVYNWENSEVSYSIAFKEEYYGNFF